MEFCENKPVSFVWVWDMRKWTNLLIDGLLWKKVSRFAWVWDMRKWTNLLINGFLWKLAWSFASVWDLRMWKNFLIHGILWKLACKFRLRLRYAELKRLANFFFFFWSQINPLRQPPGPICGQVLFYRSITNFLQSGSLPLQCRRRSPFPELSR